MIASAPGFLIMNTYSDSQGNRYTTEQINRKSDKAAKELLEIQFIEHGFNFCQKCGRNATNTYIDVSHTISRKQAKETGNAQECWNPDNLEILCRSCHQQKDGLNLIFWE